ncbi:PEP-CTERM sorting domain-containing protein [Sphingomonas rubra]|uniref:PEP-CTERM protein-sorting domain-containing protein n=1 Tax=Sphingomonas rubra TaxID=634430 RepID=A0A1I5R8R2_9SPHN|nr:PEP-CTERM sorting domain-containing protein [Sphingomonas rubra]SFP54932.1 hypothetical protein SAMN04488241_10381 [Sphingomonas rubra]
MIRMLLLAAALLGSPAAAETILFVGNSFTFGATSAVQDYRPGSVADLNGEGVGGVPALFARFAEQAGLDYRVSLETAPGRSLAWHLTERRDRIDRAWDHVVLQEYSTLDPDRPGDPARTIAAAQSLAALLRARNPGVDLRLTATWSRPDLVYRPGSRWSGTPIDRMARDLRVGADRAAEAARARVMPVGEAFTCAIRGGVADPNPYDGIAAGQVDLWGGDHYHGSTAGYYLEALVVFGAVTGRDPTALGRDEKAAADLGLSPDRAAALQRVAKEALASDGGCGR